MSKIAATTLVTARRMCWVGPDRTQVALNVTGFYTEGDPIAFHAQASVSCTFGEYHRVVGKFSIDSPYRHSGRFATYKKDAESLLYDSAALLSRRWCECPGWLQKRSEYGVTCLTIYSERLALVAGGGGEVIVGRFTTTPSRASDKLLEGDCVMSCGTRWDGADGSVVMAAGAYYVQEALRMFDMAVRLKSQWGMWRGPEYESVGGGGRPDHNNP